MGDRSIVERLRSALLYEGWGGESELPELAVGRIEELEAALMPFAEESDRIHSVYDDGKAPGDHSTWPVLVKYLRRARAALQDGGGK